MFWFIFFVSIVDFLWAQMLSRSSYTPTTKTKIHYILHYLPDQALFRINGFITTPHNRSYIIQKNTSYVIEIDTIDSFGVLHPSHIGHWIITWSLILFLVWMWLHWDWPLILVSVWSRSLFAPDQSSLMLTEALAGWLNVQMIDCVGDVWIW